MREILFRGKAFDGGNWYYGDIFHSGANPDPVRIRDYKSRVNVQIIPKTFGQYTGLKDKNDNMIFEGDIVKLYGIENIIGTNILTVQYETGAFYLCNNNYLIALLRHYYESVEVVGNIYDNLELLEDKK